MSGAPADGGLASAADEGVEPVDDLVARAAAWARSDPDDATAGELRGVLARAAGGDALALDDLRDRFATTLAFGTAGLRGQMGAGPNRMNRVVVIRAAAGLAAFLLDARTDGDEQPSVVIGYDARHRSADLARDTAAVMTGAGITARLLPRPLPTPVLAFAVRHLGADAGVMVTASHNPAADNGYKVYLGNEDGGSQIVPPSDAAIAERIAAVGPLADVPRPGSGWEVLGEDVVDAYVAGAAAVAPLDDPPDGPPLNPSSASSTTRTGEQRARLRIVLTPMHGVGGEVALRVLARAGLTDVHVVPRQAEPDPDFPTVAFPNPEEPGALDLALDLAREVGAGLVLALDPDADRCAVAVPDPGAGGGWRVLTGDELGAVLGESVASSSVPGPLVRSVVSSRLLDRVAAAHGRESVQTLTGFKWISRVPGMAFGYEEAIGYCVAPSLVRDKDGITAAVRAAGLAAELAGRGRTLLDVLDGLFVAHGVHLTGQHAVRVDDLASITRAMERLRADPPTTLGGDAVVEATDLLAGGEGLPPTDGLLYRTAADARVVVRPSGTEPKLKAYLEVVVPATGGLGAAKALAGDRLAGLRRDVAAVIGL